MSKKVQVSNMEKFRKTIGVLFIIFIILFFLKTSIGNYLLEIKGSCTKSVLTNETTKVKYHSPTLVYNFWINGKVYDENSNVEDLSKAGDSICVVYLEWMPSINRPLSFFDEPINCNCK